MIVCRDDTHTHRVVVKFSNDLTDVHSRVAKVLRVPLIRCAAASPPPAFSMRPYPFAARPAQQPPAVCTALLCCSFVRSYESILNHTPRSRPPRPTVNEQQQPDAVSQLFLSSRPSRRVESNGADRPRPKKVGGACTSHSPPSLPPPCPCASAWPPSRPRRRDSTVTVAASTRAAVTAATAPLDPWMPQPLSTRARARILTLPTAAVPVEAALAFRSHSSVTSGS